MDEIDLKILELLQENGRMSHEEISKNLNLTRPAIHRRIYKMEESGLIDGYRALVNWEKIGYKVDTVVLVNVNTDDLNSLMDEIMKIKDSSFKIFDVYRITGEYCILVKVKARAPSDLTRFYDKILMLNGVLDTKTHLILKKKKGDYKIFS